MHDSIDRDAEGADLRRVAWALTVMSVLAAVGTTFAVVGATSLGPARLGIYLVALPFWIFTANTWSRALRSHHPRGGARA